MLAEAAEFAELGAVNSYDRWDAVIGAARMSPKDASVSEVWS